MKLTSPTRPMVEAAINVILSAQARQEQICPALAVEHMCPHHGKTESKVIGVPALGDPDLAIRRAMRAFLLQGLGCERDLLRGLCFWSSAYMAEYENPDLAQVMPPSVAPDRQSIIVVAAWGVEGRRLLLYRQEKSPSGPGAWSLGPRIAEKEAMEFRTFLDPLFA